MKKLLPFIFLMPLCGCMSLGNVASQLKDDPANVDVEVKTIYGTATFHRSFPTNWTRPATVSTNALPK